ncbi:MAG: Uma2 family endonuclease [Cyanobacteria bacterium P01_G01_bin.67]
MTVTTYKWSIEEWHELVNLGLLEGKPVEFLEGEIIEVSPEGIEHSYTNDSVVKYLRSILVGLADVRESHPITLDNSEPEPDIAIVRLPETIYRQHHPYPQDIYFLIEISHRTLKQDLEQKIITYARNGIPEYWVLDLVNKKLITHTQVQGNKYSQVAEYKTGTVCPMAFPDIAIALDKLLLF